MYLKRISLFGFKSFVDETTIEFDENLSAIVGPNGCGKSNIVDAFKWCMGEQSTTSLRVKSMTDLIFSGTQTRQPLGFAETSLLFDNSSNLIPLSFSEVSVARRIYSSGENEYLINKTPCRLKDIKEMFANTGVSTEGYSVIEQGKVEFVFTARPEERRKLLEEAAGIAKYRLQKEETIRKLELTTDKLEKVLVIMDEIKSQMKSMENLVKKAKNYQKLKDELKTLEIASHAKRIVALKNEFDDMKVVYEAVCNSVEKIENERKITLENIAAVEKEMKEREKSNQESQNQLNLLKLNLVRVEEQMKLLKERVSEFESQRDDIEKRINALNSRRACLSDLVSVSKREIEEMESTLRREESAVNEMEKRISSASNELASLRERLNEINECIISIAVEKSDAKTKMSRLKAEIESSQRVSLKMQKNLVEKSKLREAIEEEIRNIEKDIDEVKGSITMKENELEDSKSMLETLVRQREEIQCELSKLRDGKALLDSRIQKYPEEIAKFITRNFKGIHGPIKKVIKIDDGYENDIKNALREKQWYLIGEKTEDVLAVINYLKDKKCGVFTFVVLERIPDVEHQAVSASLMKYVSCEPKFKKALIYLLSDSSLTPEGNIIEGPIITGGEEDEMNIKFDEIVNEERKKEAGLIQVEDSIKQINKRIQEISFNLHELNLKNDFLLKNLMTKKPDLKLIEDEIDLLKSEILQYEAAEEEIFKKISECESKLKKAEKDEEKFMSEKQQIENGIPKLLEELKELEKEYKRLNIEYFQHKEKYEASLKNCERSSYEISAAEKEIESLRLELDDIISKIDLQSKLILKFEHEYNSLQDSIEVEMKRMISQDAVLSNMYEQLQHLKEQLKNIDDELNKRRSEKYDLELKIETLKMEIKSHMDKIAEFCVGENEINNYVGVEVSDEKIQLLRKKIASMGEINLLVTEQYDGLQQRYNFLKEQYDDLVKAESNLRSAMLKINNLIEENFKNIFRIVNTNFKDMFSELFGGGDARLILTNEKDILESGIDIVAHPPGKRLANIYSLSGGEKALTAIALLFALFMVKPSPVCLLDEVDANLDESNVLRFVNLLKKFAEKSQFIIITHNKRTIESVDTIYGVTMEESGVSRVYTIKLNKFCAA